MCRSTCAIGNYMLPPCFVLSSEAKQNKGGTAKNLSKFLSEGQIFLERLIKED